MVGEAVGEAGGFEVKGVSFSAEGRTILSGIDLTIRPGRVCGLIGHNGSGKSTLIKILARQQAPGSGSVSLDGRDVQAWEARAFARRVAYLPQATPPATGLSVRELVSFGRYPWHGPFGRVGPDDRAKIAHAIEIADVGLMVDRLVDTLSGGERQRAWIASLVAQDAGFILLDEPISALDLRQQVEVLRFVRDLARRRGTGIVAVLHDINMAARFCDEIVALKAGSVLTRGTPAEVMRADVLEAIYDLPMHVIPHPAGEMPIGFAR